MPIILQDNPFWRCRCYAAERNKEITARSRASFDFAQDYINTKLLGHAFELVGTADIINPKMNLLKSILKGFISRLHWV